VRVLLVNKFWTPVGGVEEHCLQLEEMLQQEGHEVVRFGMARADNEPPLPVTHSVSEVAFHGGGVRDRLRAGERACLGGETRSKLGVLLDEERFDLVHVVHSYHQLGMTFFPLLRRRGIPTILDLHDYKVGCPRYLLFNDRTGQTCTVCLDKRGAWAWAPATRRCWKGSISSGIMLSMEALSARLSKAYTGVDRVVVRNELQQDAALHAGVAEEKLRLIPPWIDLRDEGPSGSSLDGRILFVGRLVQEKGVDTLIRAAAIAGVPIRIVGDGAQRPELEALIRSTGADVELIGWRHHDEVLEEVAAAKALVVPSIWPEVFGLVICEAFSVGTPVIGSRIGAIPELLDEGRGHLFTPGDALALARILEKIDGNPDFATQSVGPAYEYSRVRFSYDRWRTQYGEIYEELM
jgi:glycosyltransferase involved in cell wall biosynthesis